MKFSDDTDLDDRKCIELLKEAMPPCVKNHKITQKLFIEYV